ncbi:MAG: SEC-C domain-containing protein [Elusimicrobia bacterium]|nr:SEC-C domain-containing protein [Elusimicrobiota bacterium]
MEFYHPDRILERRRRSERGRLSERQAEWPWMRALAAFVREGPSLEAERLMREALGRNRHLPDYLLGRKDLPEKLPRAVTPGCRDEAQLCAPALHIAWERVPGALRWLAGDHGLPESGKVGRNEPCPCGSGKKFKKCCLDRAAGHA